MPLSVIILGAGIAGLTAASALRRSGHSVTILEKSAFSTQELGAALGVAPNSACILERLDVSLEEAGANHAEGFAGFRGTGETKIQMSLDGLAKGWKTPWWFVHRGDFHAQLRKVALERGAKLVLGCAVRAIDPEAGKVELADGTVYESDLIVGADGVNSFARQVVQPGATLRPWGKRCYRWLLDKEMVASDPETRELVKEDGYFVDISEEDRKIVMYPCRKNTVLNTAAFLPDDEAEVDSDWNQSANREKLAKGFEKFYPPARKLLTFAGEDLRSWQIFDMESLKHWTKGRLVLIGDAAHPFMPFLSQGGAQAIEDAAALGVIVDAGSQPEKIPELLKLFESIRKPRADYIQQETRTHGLDEDKGRPPPKALIQMLDWCHKYDEWAHTEEVMKDKLTQVNGS